MNIKWFGQSCFLITLADGKRVVIDPVGRMLGYKMPKVEADVLAVTHSHRDHNRIEYVSGNYTLVNKPKEYQLDDIWIKGIPTFHDQVGGAKRGNNIVFVFKMDGLTICHCGDLGHGLSEDQVREIGNVDILMVPAGGKMTLGGEAASQVVRQLHPAVAIPMHYRTKALGLPGKLMFEKVDTFTALVDGPKQHYKELTINSGDTERFSGVVTLDYVFS